MASWGEGACSAKNSQVSAGQRRGARGRAGVAAGSRGAAEPPETGKRRSALLARNLVSFVFQTLGCFGFPLVFKAKLTAKRNGTALL